VHRYVPLIINWNFLPSDSVFKYTGKIIIRYPIFAHEKELTHNKNYFSLYIFDIRFNKLPNKAMCLHTVSQSAVLRIL
jgi:hypothetical protein